MHRYYTSMKTKLLVTLVFFAGLCVFDAKAAQGRFQHPGIGLNREQLDQLKANVQGGVEPWKTLYDALTKHDHRFSKKPRIFARRGEGITQIDSPDFDNRCAWDSQTAYYQGIMYEITGEAEYRERALDYVRWFYTHITGGRPHWDSQFRWPNRWRATSPLAPSTSLSQGSHSSFRCSFRFAGLCRSRASTRSATAATHRAGLES